MATYKFTLSIGYPSARVEEIFDLPEVDDMEQDEREKYLSQVWDDWSCNYVDGGWKVLDKE